MLATTSVLIKTDDGREALAARRHDMQMRQRHLLILIDGARTVGQLHQLLGDWPDLDELLAGLRQAGMVDVLPNGSPQDAPAAATFDPITHFNRPLFDEEASGERASLSGIYDELPPLTGMTLGLQTQTAPADEPAANEARLGPIQTAPAPPHAIPPELADVLPNVVKVELMRLAIQHFGSAAGAAMPLLRACKEDTQSLRDMVTACAHATAPMVGKQAISKFVDAALRAIAQRQ